MYYPVQGGPKAPLDSHGLEAPLCQSQLQATPFVLWGPELCSLQPVSLLEFPFSALGLLGSLRWQRLGDLAASHQTGQVDLCVHFGVVLGLLWLSGDSQSRLLALPALYCAGIQS